MIGPAGLAGLAWLLMPARALDRVVRLIGCGPTCNPARSAQFRNDPMPIAHRTTTVVWNGRRTRRPRQRLTLPGLPSAFRLSLAGGLYLRADLMPNWLTVNVAAPWVEQISKP